MKNLHIVFTSILVIGLLISCSSEENYEDLLRKIMVQRIESMKALSEIPFKDTIIENGDVFFGIETDAEHYNLRGNYHRRNDFLEFRLYEVYWDGVSEGSLTALYKNEDGNWVSAFTEPLVNGSLDTIIDLNYDKVYEVIMKERSSSSHGKDPCEKLVLYGQKNSTLLEEVGILAERISSENKLVTDYSISFDTGSDGVTILVYTATGEDLSENSTQMDLTHRFKWETPILTDLNKAELPMSDSLLKFNQDGLWGLKGQNGVVIPPLYNDILDISEGMIALQKEDLWGFADVTGKIVIPCQYRGVSAFTNGKAVVRIKGYEDWQTAFKFIDNKGIDIGLFFSQVSGTQCIEEKVTGFSDKEWAELKNCPNGIQSIKNPYEEGENEMTFYPNTTIENIITIISSDEGTFSEILKKFNGTPLEFTEEGKKYSLNLEKDLDGKLIKVYLKYEMETFIKTISFEQTNNGVFVTENTSG